MRYPNPHDEDEVCCYFCSDYLTKRIASEYSGVWACPFCIVSERDYRASRGLSVDPLPIKARRFLAGHVKAVQAALKYPVGA